MLPLDPSWRQATPACDSVIHLNNAGASLMPQSVLRAVTAHLERESQLGGYESSDAVAAEGEAAYAHVARLVGAHPRNIAIVENATVAFFKALAAFDFQPGDVILTTRNDYISNQLAYLSLAQRRGVQVRRAEDLPEGGVDPQSVRELLRGRGVSSNAGGRATGRVRLLAVTWVPTNSGLIQPVEALGAIAEEAGVPYLVDACQAVGQLPVDVARLRCDYLSATARKFLRGPRGIGFLYVSDRALARGDFPLLVDMRGADWTSADAFALVPDARRFENWEFAYCLVLGLGEAARYALEVGIEQGGRRARELAADLRARLAPLPGYRVLDRGAELAALVTVEVPGHSAPDLVSLLRRQRINTSASLREYAVIDMDQKRAASALRISPHYYNTEEEIAAIVDALRSLQP
ncbi:MAG TPA: aminotransferase class V-fold PLP-dependent enzyme [Candidatus Acidoferrales bacterium]|nr:aminotransferase class V-fold PLP-dependent enzyme [Candidatus Acidoferrales bacterium]